MGFNFQSYYQSHLKLGFIGSEGQGKLQNAKVLVIGAGGLGCPCLQYLTTCGVGLLGIADFDTISLSNLHRQILYNPEDVGKLKTEVIKERLPRYNPGIKIQLHNGLVDISNVLSLIKEYDIIVDCTDNFQVRYLINDACVIAGKPLVYGAIYQTEGHVTVFNYQQSGNLRCLFPQENNETIQSCADIGAYNIITGIIGSMLANEVVKIILHHKDVLAGKLCQIDALTVTMKQIKYHLSPYSIQKSFNTFSASIQSLEISQSALKEKIKNNEGLFLIDVRESKEHKAFNIGGELIPLQSLLNRNSFPFSQNDTIICYCEIGIRSLKAAKYLSSLGFKHVFNLHGGVKSWIS
ncbi:MAG: HesA/MoeB/ThiF family protein [Bacteroidota bacterium]